MKRIWIFVLFVLLGLPSLSEACREFHSVAVDDHGNVQAGAAVLVTNATTGAVVTLYGAPGCQTAIGNPILTTAVGDYQFFVKDGVYTITVSKVGLNTHVIRNIAIISQFGENIRNISEFGTLDLCIATTGVIDQIGATPTTLVISQGAFCTVSKTAPATLHFIIEYPGTVTVSTTKTLAIQGQIMAGADLIFPGPGTTTYTSQILAYGAWTGSTGITVNDVVNANPKTDVSQFYSAVQACSAFEANPSLLKPNRIGTGTTALTRTAGGAETYNIVCYLTAPTRTTAGKGYKLFALKIAQQITVAALTSNVLNAVDTVTYVNNVANAVASYGGSVTATMPTATQTNPYVTVVTLGTPAYMNTADTAIVLDFTVVLQNTGVYSLFGITAIWNVQD